MFRSLFGKGKRKRPSGSRASTADDTIRSAGVGDVVVMTGFSPTYEDAYFIVEAVARYESPVGKWYELTGVDGDRRVGIEWSDDDGLFISVTEQDEPKGLGSLDITNDQLVSLDDEQSIDNRVTYEGEMYAYRNSHEVYYFKDNRGEGEGFYSWEFVSEDRQKMVSVVKWEGMPFEVYASVVVSPNIVRIYKE
jgi:hypothetical protein